MIHKIEKNGQKTKKNGKKYKKQKIYVKKVI